MPHPFIKHFSLPFISLLLLMMVSPHAVFAQKSDQDSVKEKRVDFKILPYFSYNRKLKFMLGVVPMVTYRTKRNDTISPKSMTGLAAVYTTNGSYFVGLFNRIFLNEDRWRITMYAVTGNQNSQFYMDDFTSPGFYDYATLTSLISVGAQRRVVPGFYLGLNYTYSNFYTEYEDNVNPPSTTITNGLEVTSLLDTRNSVYYPTAGSQSRLKFYTMPEWFGNELTAQKIKAEYNAYFSMAGNRDVLAARVAGFFGLGDIAFEQQEVIGNKDIRGYSLGKYRGDGVLAIQGEYRYNFYKKMGLVGFGGLATIYGSDTPEFNGQLYPSIGIGYRYMAFEDMHFNIGLDAAVGKDDWGLYFRLGEAF